MKSTLSLEHLEDVGSHWSEDHEMESVGSNESFENEPDQDEGLPVATGLAVEISNVCPENPTRDGKVDPCFFGKSGSIQPIQCIRKVYSDPFPFSTF